MNAIQQSALLLTLLGLGALEGCGETVDFGGPRTDASAGARPAGGGDSSGGGGAGATASGGAASIGGAGISNGGGSLDRDGGSAGDAALGGSSSGRDGSENGGASSGGSAGGGVRGGAGNANGGSASGAGGASDAGGNTSASGGVSASGGSTGDSGTGGGTRTTADAGPGRNIPVTCDDNVRDGDETDIDCGGSCPPCSLAQHCIGDADCGLDLPGCDVAQGGCVCDEVTHSCATSHCVDQRKDRTESDVDCGGTDCNRCAFGQGCAVDYDCALFDPQCSDRGCACDSVTSKCVHDNCVDHHQDVNETGVDCGGGCAGCALGQRCYYDGDCASGVCDDHVDQCATDHCTDDNVDFDESDYDCGGGACKPCRSGDLCNSNLDCQGGLCSMTTSRHVCE